MPTLHTTKVMHDHEFHDMASACAEQGARLSLAALKKDKSASQEAISMGRGGRGERRAAQRRKADLKAAQETLAFLPLASYRDQYKAGKSIQLLYHASLYMYTAF